MSKNELSSLNDLSQIKSHSPQDYIHGPLNIPDFCWPFIDTPEFQRLRYVKQLSTVELVYPGATHSRFEHSLGCAHLANQFMQHLSTIQPELNITTEQKQAVIIASLCHDLGHGPWSHSFEKLANVQGTKHWSHERMSELILKFIYQKLHKTKKTTLSEIVIDAACLFIKGKAYKNWPFFLAEIISNEIEDIDIDKFDYLARDMLMCLSINDNEYIRLIINSRVSNEGKLCWKLSEIATIQRLFSNRNDMHNRVYQHRVVQAVEHMVHDMLQAAFSDSNYNFDDFLDNPEEFVKLDDRILYLCEQGEMGKEAQRISLEIKSRNLYKYIGELRISPTDLDGMSYSQANKAEDYLEDISQYCGKYKQEFYLKFRISKMYFRYGLSHEKGNPLSQIPFWKEGSKEVIYLAPDQISCIGPAYFKETAIRVFFTDPDPEKIAVATKAFQQWKDKKFHPT